ncbi:DUF1588 domain-containing protein [Lignipirellula cremea]|uniref:Planctomycete cytochrome C n=1 Tax=Lignipirellula cremea TaxID=2528010 RepID=A0A518DM44_9BACT|nr:DUF1588 domain-containing protein [Lignipirellula cremea]QDU92914.1 Planctomycete cytochrome C [Lignipirellula cremea]
MSKWFAFACLSVLLLLAVGSLAPVCAADAAFLKRFCIDCHGGRTPEGDLSLQHLQTTAVKPADLELWQAVLAQVESRQMPPEEADQPTAAERKQMVEQITSLLTGAGVAVRSGRRLAPGQGNYVDHEALFSQQPSLTPPGSKTSARMWRLTGQAYEEFFDQLNKQYAMGIRNYGEHKMRAPWNFAPEPNFTDYASSHKIGEAEIEFHMRNATKMAKALVVRLAGRQPSPGFSDWIPEMNAVILAGDAATAEQVQAATTATFQGVLSRDPSPKEQERFTQFLLQNLQTLEANEAVEQFLIALLFRPEMMYRVEIAPDGSTRGMLAPRALARSLAFALTDQVPDEALLLAVEEGRLSTREDVQAQVARMLADKELHKPRILRFFQEYFGHHAAIEVFKDEVTLKAAGLHVNFWYPRYFVSDADRLIEWVLNEDKDVLRQLLTTNKTFLLTMDPLGRDKYGESTKVKKRLQPDTPFQGFEQTVLDVYETPLPSRHEWFDDRPYDMPKEHRAGLLTHPAWLIAQSGNFDNHAIHRGRWIREKLLGGLVPEVPITVNAMLPDEPQHGLRERMAVTREAYCWKCHRQMDPLGLAFEQFDHFGRFRTTEQVVDLEATQAKANLDKDGHPRLTKYTTIPLDTTGAVERSGAPDLDGPVADPLELVRKLAASERVEQVFVRHAFRYFMGRNETLADGPILVAAHRAYVDNGGSMNALITSLLTSDAFLYRTLAVDE